jgi:hypothetical protein
MFSSTFRSFKRRPRDVTSGPDLSCSPYRGYLNRFNPHFFVNPILQSQKVELVMRVADTRAWLEIMKPFGASNQLLVWNLYGLSSSTPLYLRDKVTGEQVGQVLAPSGDPTS